MFFPKPYLLALVILCCTAISAQQSALYQYQDLSNARYKPLKDSLKKAWVCPVNYKEKATQKKYSEIWNSRTDFLFSAIDNNSFIRDGEVYDYVQGIVAQLFAANRDRMETMPLLLIDRSSSINAYALGGNIIAVNLGLIAFSESREELSLAIAHEISHNLLMHPENAFAKNAEWLTSDEYKKSLDAVLDSKYERLSRLKKISETYSFNRNRHQRYHEKEADSVAIALLKKSQIAFDANFFLRLDSADSEYKRELQQPVNNYFNSYGLQVNPLWTQNRSKGLSTRSYNFKDTTKLADSLKTHPDCKERFVATQKYTDAGKSMTAINSSIKERVTKMMVWNLFNNMSLTPCLYRVLLEKDKGNKDPWFDFMAYNVFMGLLYADNDMHRFNAIGIMPKEYISRNYYELQTMLEKIPREDLRQSCQTFKQADFWKEMRTPELSLKGFVDYLAFSTTDEKERDRKAVDFMSTNPTSLYCEFVTIFKKK